MKKRYNKFNPKRRLKKTDVVDYDQLKQLAQVVMYGGNPEHKKNPGDFGLIPPSDPRPGKSLCDAAGIFKRSIALSLLRQGLCKGMVSDRCNNSWPKNIWAVTMQGIPLEAQLENSDLGTYHGYPMPESDPLATEVIRRWNQDRV